MISLKSLSSLLSFSSRHFDPKPADENTARSRKYQYKSLEKPTHIRILHLGVRSGEDLQCTIEHADILKAKFKAFSYVWGSPETPYVIHVKGKCGEPLGTIPLTKNLNDALHCLRDTKEIEEKIVWIDQICINQEDPEERSKQIAMMGPMYRNALQVVTFLGPGELGDAEAIDLFIQIHNHFKPYYNSDDRTAFRHRRHFRSSKN
jgi:hypothetical protein